jgi:hypothetical protein
MTDTTWPSLTPGNASRTVRQSPSSIAMLARVWKIRVLVPLHRALDSALRADELRTLNQGILDDMGYRRY